MYYWSNKEWPNGRNPSMIVFGEELQSEGDW